MDHLNQFMQTFDGDKLVLSIILSKDQFRAKRKIRLEVFVKGKFIDGAYFSYSNLTKDGQEYKLGTAVIEGLTNIYLEGETNFVILSDYEKLAGPAPVVDIK